MAAPSRRAPGALNSFRGAVQDIQSAQQHLNRASSSMPGLTDAERRARIIAHASSWRAGTGMGLYKEVKTADTQEGPGTACPTGLVTLAIHACLCRQSQEHPQAENLVLYCAGWFAFKSDASAIYGLIMSSWMNVLLVMAPLGVLAHYLHWGPVAVFLLNFAALVPLALLLGEVTEDLAVRFGSTIGGLLNATFGNVVELILSIAALTKGLYVVIAASLIGSILSNLLLVLGMHLGAGLSPCRNSQMLCCSRLHTTLQSYSWVQLISMLRLYHSQHNPCRPIRNSNVEQYCLPCHQGPRWCIVATQFVLCAGNSE